VTVRNALIDTGILQDYLQGDERAYRVLSAYEHRSISVITWLELMSACPPALQEATRSFLRGFERLSISESIADEAQRLMDSKPGLPLQRALTWATAVVNQLAFVTADASHTEEADRLLVLAYSRP
jgi:predicted nucleic acid-binding protein